MPKALRTLTHQTLQMPYAALIVMVSALAALLFAFTLQYGFDIQPCVLCLWQRVPFGFVVAFGLTACIWRPYATRARVLLSLCALAFAICAALAFFHTGVERHWWEGTRGCSIQPLHATTAKSLREEIMAAAVGHCDQISWTFLGLSMANWNIPFSGGLSLFSVAAVIAERRRKKS